MRPSARWRGLRLFAAFAETIAALQKNLSERGIGSLATTLSLGVDDRQRPRACDVPHDHALACVAS